MCIKSYNTETRKGVSAEKLNAWKDMIRSQIKIIISSQPGIEPSVKNRSA